MWELARFHIASCAHKSWNGEFRVRIIYFVIWQHDILTHARAVGTARVGVRIFSCYNVYCSYSVAAAAAAAGENTVII